jgi:hypothetical protein
VGCARGACAVDSPPKAVRGSHFGGAENAVCRDLSFGARAKTPRRPARGVRPRVVPRRHRGRQRALSVGGVRGALLPGLDLRSAYRHLGTDSSGERLEQRVRDRCAMVPGARRARIFGVRSKGQSGKGTSRGSSMWLICGHKVRRSGAGVEPTERWVTPPHWF